jgi:hypothetical protein
LENFYQKAKWEMRNMKLKWFWKVSITKTEGKKGKNCLFLIVCFECVAININGWLKILYSYLVYSQIWLNLLKDDHHVFYIVLCMIATWATTVLWYFTSLTSAKTWDWCHGPWGS